MKYLLYFFIIFFTQSSLDPFLNIEAPPVDDIPESSWPTNEDLSFVLDDPEKLINAEFRLNPFFYNSTKFWFLIYSKYSSYHMLIHDRENLNLVYRVLDFSSLKKQNLNLYVRNKVQQQVTKEKSHYIKKAFDSLINNSSSVSPQIDLIKSAILNSGLELPENERERKKILLKLKNNIRTQSGQADFIREGFERSIPHQAFIKNVLEIQGLPHELMAIPFLESSFNPKAYSKVAAVGIWQLMPRTAKHYLPAPNKKLDYRKNIHLSTLASTRMLRENFRILKDWGLTITSYNSGIGGILKAKRKVGKTNFNLEDFINLHQSDSFGFASKNFFSEFTALVHLIAYEKTIYPDLFLPPFQTQNISPEFYLQKCPLKEADINKLFSQHSNLSLLNFDKIGIQHFPKSTIWISSNDLPDKKFLKLDFENSVNTYPKHWLKNLGNYNCSTK